MVVLRRILTGLLVVALAQFGAMATAPAHAHEAGDDHGVREMLLSHDRSDAGTIVSDHDHDFSHEDHAAALDDTGDQSTGSDAAHSEHAHVHVCPQFTENVAQKAVVRSRYGEIIRPVEPTADIRHSSFPPLRPPRATL